MYFLALSPRFAGHSSVEVKILKMLPICAKYIFQVIHYFYVIRL